MNAGSALGRSQNREWLARFTLQHHPCTIYYTYMLMVEISENFLPHATRRLVGCQPLSVILPGSLPLLVGPTGWAAAICNSEW